MATYAAKALSTGSGPDALVLKISQDAWQGSAQYTVKVDGVQIGDVFTASALKSLGQSDTLTLNGNWTAGAHHVEVDFKNDLYGGTAATDRNLYVDGITYNGAAVQGGQGDLKSPGIKSFGFTEAASAPAIVAPFDKLTVYLSGDSWNGNPQARITVNGMAVGGVFDVSAKHGSDEVQAFTVTGQFGEAPVVTLSFFNDASAGRADADRNLYLSGFEYNSVQHLHLKDELYYNQTLNFTLDGSPTHSLRAEDFLGSLGVCVHLTYWDTAYGLAGGSGPDMAKILASLQYLGIDRVRVGVPDSNTTGPMAQLAAQGIKFNVLMPSASSDAALRLQLDKLHPFADSILSIEGPNETNITPDFSWNGQKGYQAARDYQDVLYRAVKEDKGFSHTDVISLTLAGVGKEAYREFGDISADVDRGNMHVYFANGTAPASTVRYALDLSEISTGDKPVVFTETNYSTANRIMGSVSESTQSKYVLDMLMDAKQSGVDAIYLYELLDEHPDPNQTNVENHFGLFYADGTPKPVATALHNLNLILSDTGKDALVFKTGELPYRLTNLPASGNSILLEKSSGQFDIVVWAEPEIWDLASKTERHVAARDVLVELDRTADKIEIFDPLLSDKAIAIQTNVSQVIVALSDHPVVVQVTDADWL